MENYYLLIIGMGLATYLPRVFPLLFLKDNKFSGTIQSFLNNIPYAALGALILPGVIYSTGDYIYSAVGALTAIILAFFRLNLLFVVIGSITSIFIWQLFF